jgi:hypothetical protein
MIYDLKAEGRDVNTRAEPKLESPQCAKRTQFVPAGQAGGAVAEADRAKQSQFGEPRPGSGGRLCDIASMPRFGKQTQFRGSPTGTQGSIMRNEAKLGRAGVSGAQDGGDERRANAPNKPNFGHGKAKGKWFAGKELRPIGPAESAGKTKPISGRAGGAWDERRMRQTNPIWGGVSSLKFQVLRRARPLSGLQTSHFTLQTRPKAVCAKQTEFLPSCRSGDRRSREGKACETNPISGSPRGTGIRSATLWGQA